MLTPGRPSPARATAATLIASQAANVQLWIITTLSPVTLFLSFVLLPAIKHTSQSRQERGITVGCRRSAGCLFKMFDDCIKCKRIWALVDATDSSNELSQLKGLSQEVLGRRTHPILNSAPQWKQKVNWWIATSHNGITLALCVNLLIWHRKPWTEAQHH